MKMQRKQQDLDKLKTELPKYRRSFSSTFQGITVEDDTKLRRAVQAAGGKYKVCEEHARGARRRGYPRRELLKNLSGTNRSPYTAADPVAAGQRHQLAKDVPAFQFKSGVVEGRVISIMEIQQLANLPSKEELISKIMFC